MQTLPPEITRDGAAHREHLLGFVDGFKRECGRDVQFVRSELVDDDGEQFIVTEVITPQEGRGFLAVGYHLPDPMETYAELGAATGAQLRTTLEAH